jgi:formate hydrogenlyase subunit 6/NADH:ubiquinone oxidoreductase subunit I
MFQDLLASAVRPPITERYPFERQPPPIRLRGRLCWDPDHCIGCRLCVKDCPSEALEVFVVDKESKRYVVAYHVDRCTFCGQCVTSCRQGGLSLNHESWELAALDRRDFELFFGREEDIERVREGELIGHDGS